MSYDNTLRVWDPINCTGNQVNVAITTIKPGKLYGEVTSLVAIKFCRHVTVLSDGRVAVMHYSDYRYGIYIYNATITESAHVLEHHYSVMCIIPLSNNRLASGCSIGGSIHIWDCDKGKRLKVLKGYDTTDASSLAVIDDNRIACGSKDTIIRVWDITTGECTHELIGHSDSIACLLMHPSGRLISGSCGGIIGVWNRTTRVLEHVLNVQRNVSSLCLLSNGCFASATLHQKVQIWKMHDDDKTAVAASSPVCVQTIEGVSKPYSLMCLPNDGTLVIGTLDGHIELWKGRK